MNLKKMFSPRTVRKKIIITSKFAGVLLIASYLFSTHISDDPDVSLLVWLGFVIPLILAVDFLMGRFISWTFPNPAALPRRMNSANSPTA